MQSSHVTSNQKIRARIKLVVIAILSKNTLGEDTDKHEDISSNEASSCFRNDDRPRDEFHNDILKDDIMHVLTMTYCFVQFANYNRPLSCVSGIIQLYTSVGLFLRGTTINAEV